ncbi:par-3 family cell polarity regulator beta a isoform X2 [Electrophorus electricus]|uniref:par-3 family cell polarity regulator beta a isoform X2 n=1 Tax=Electrophorus electricus TaxID=8005 RepID=UPI0015CFEDB4|nr:par-3 family cell polarity regulator beta a isoform X2 [Electrophorus electricus]
MKVTVNFGRTGVVVPCKDGWVVRDLIDQATQRYKKIVEQDGEFLVRTHHVEYADGGILDPDDMLTDLVDDKDKLIAVYEEMELQQGAPASSQGSTASGYSSPEPSEPELGMPHLTSEIEVTSVTLKSNTPLLVRSSSESVLTPPLETGFWEADNPGSRPLTTGTGNAPVKPIVMDRPKDGVAISRPIPLSSSVLTRAVEISGDMRPLGIKVVPYCSSLSGRTLGLQVNGIEDNGRSKKEGIFQEDECIVNINGTQLIDKSFAESQEVFRQAMSTPAVRLEVLPVANKLQYEKSLISQLFNSSDSAHQSAPKLKSPFLLGKADTKHADPPPAVQALLPKEDPPARHVPAETERLEETPPPLVHASPTPKPRSESPAPRRSPAHSMMASAANKKGGKNQRINLTKGVDGLGFTVVTRDSSVHGPGPILVKSILPRGAAIRDGRLQSGDRILEVNGVDITGHTQEELVAMLRSTKLGETVSLVVTRQDELFLPRELKGDSAGPSPSEDGREHLMFEVPLNDSGSAGLGVSLKGNKSRETGEDLGIFIKSIIHGGAAFKDRRLHINDQLVAVNGESLLGRSNHDAMETLRRSMSMEGNLRGTIQLVVLRTMEHSPSQDRESPPIKHANSSQTNEVSRPQMVANSIYQRGPGPTFHSNGRHRVYEEEDDGDFPPADTMETGDWEPVSAQSDPTHQHHQPQQAYAPLKPPAAMVSRSLDLVTDVRNVGAVPAQRPAFSSSSDPPLGPALGLHKSSSLESLQTAVEEAGRRGPTYRRPPGRMVRGRTYNMSFRQAIDKSYDGPSEPEDDYSDDSSGRDTPASGSSRQELEDGAKEKKRTRKKKEKKTKAKKKEDAEDPEKRTKKKGFTLLRFGRKNKEDKAKSKANLGALSEEEIDRSEAEIFPYAREMDSSIPGRGFLQSVEDDDFDPNYARINAFREPAASSPSLHHTLPLPAAHSAPAPSEDDLEGLYAKVNKLKPAPQPVTDSTEARLQQIRNQFQHLKPVPPYAESGITPRVHEYDPSRIRGPESRMAPRYEDVDRQYASVPRRIPTDAQLPQTLAGQREAGRLPTPSPSYGVAIGREAPPQAPASPHLPVSKGPIRQEVPPSPTPAPRGVPSYEAVVRGGHRDGRYPDPRQKNPAIGAV